MKIVSRCLQLGLVIMVAACEFTIVKEANDIAGAAPSTDVNPKMEVESIQQIDDLAYVSTSAKPVSEPTAPKKPIDLWQRLRNGFQLEHQIHRNRVKREIAWFRKHPDYMQRVAARAEKHLHHIVDQLEANNLPLEFALLPVVESAYDPFAYSHGRASGLWQFIPATARLQGLRIDWWYDGRRDVIDSTDAAIRYLDHLNQRMGEDWLLALAAYNWGEGNLRASIRKNELRQRQTDFWSLDLPKETTTYVPRLLALCAIVANPKAFEMNLEDIHNEPYWKVIDIGSQLDLGKAAELAGITNQELYQLNPGYNQWSTHPDGPHRLLIPVENANRFSRALAKLSQNERLTWKRHRIATGESLGYLANKFDTTVSALRSVNNISGSLIRAGDSILIPVASQTSDYPMTSQARLKKDQNYWQQQYGSKPIRHVIQPGDSLWKIARQYSVGLRQLAKWNGIGTTTTLHPGKELVVFRPSSEVLRKVSYRVRRGESFAKIANKFNLTVASIMSWNQKAAKARYLHPGDNLTLFVDVTAQD